jgi:predicted nucleic-acid-binding Zn-ribbon protein
MANQYSECPKCGNDEWADSLLVDRWESDCEWVWRQISCGKCGFEWQEVYEFIHNEDFDANELDDKGNVLFD